MSSKRVLVAVTAISALMLGGCAGGETVAPGATSATPGEATDAAGLTLQMRAQNDSGQDGMAILTPTTDGRTRVVLQLANSPGGPQPAHINAGTCENIGEIVYVLGGVRGGSIDASVDASLDSLLAGDFAVSVARSPSDFGVIVSCAAITR